MRHLCILVQEPLSFSIVDGEIREEIRIGNTLFTRCSMDPDTVVFYDWLLNDSGIVRGLEIHLSPYDSLLRSPVPLSNINSIEIDYFVRIWFSQYRDGFPCGMEAFGDILFFRAQEGKLAIIVSIENWLPQPQAHQIIVNYGSQEDKAQ